MRPSTTIYFTRVELPEHLRALRGELRGGGSQAPPEVLGPVSALAELLAVLGATVDGPGPPQTRADRESLRDDVRDAFEGLGPEVGGHLSAAWRTFVGDVGQLPTLLTTSAGARAVRGGAHALRSALVSPQAARAAWNDVVSAFENNEVAELGEQRLLQLREVVEARGHVWKTMRQRLEGLLNDDPAYMPDVKQRPRENDMRPLANVPIDERLRRAGDAVSADVSTGELVAWVAFQNAWLDDMYLRLGPVEFFAHQLWPEAVRKGNFVAGGVGPAELDEQPPDELSYTDAFSGLPEKDFVLARVALDVGPVGGGAERARRLVQDLVHTARPGSDWALMDGTAVYLDGRGWNFNRFRDPRWREEAERREPRSDPTAFELGDVDERFVAALAGGAPEAEGAAEYVRWEVALRQIPAAQRLALSTRILEQALPGGQWQSTSTRYLRDHWAELQLGFWLRDLAFAVLSIHPGSVWNAGDKADQEAYEALEDELTPSTGRLMFRFHGDRALRLLPPMAREMPEGSVERRLLDELAARVATGPAAADWLTEFEARFDRLLSRAARQRNAVIHGTRIVPAVVATIEVFMAELVGRVVAEKVHAVGSGTSAEQAMDEVRAAVSERRQRLTGGELAEDVLFQSEP